MNLQCFLLMFGEELFQSIHPLRCRICRSTSVAHQLCNLKGKAPAIIRICIRDGKPTGPHYHCRPGWTMIGHGWRRIIRHQSTEWRHGSLITHRALFHPCKKQHPIQAEIFSRWLDASSGWLTVPAIFMTQTRVIRHHRLSLEFLLQLSLCSVILSSLQAELEAICMDAHRSAAQDDLNPFPPLEGDRPRSVFFLLSLFHNLVLVVTYRFGAYFARFTK